MPHATLHNQCSDALMPRHSPGPRGRLGSPAPHYRLHMANPRSSRAPTRCVLGRAVRCFAGHLCAEIDAHRRTASDTTVSPQTKAKALHNALLVRTCDA